VVRMTWDEAKPGLHTVRLSERRRASVGSGGGSFPLVLPPFASNKTPGIFGSWLDEPRAVAEAEGIACTGAVV
jgi:hypothetical protein